MAETAYWHCFLIIIKSIPFVFLLHGFCVICVLYTYVCILNILLNGSEGTENLSVDYCQPTAYIIDMVIGILYNQILNTYFIFCTGVQWSHFSTI